MVDTVTDAPGDQEGLSTLIGQLTSLADASDKLSVHDIREKIGERSFGPFLIIPAVIEISPIGGIPGLPTVIAVIITLFAVQILLGRKHLWLPQFVENRSVDPSKLKKGLEKLKPVSRWVDKLIRPRLTWATRPPYLQGVAALIILLCAMVPPLELLPFASTVPMAAIILLGLSLMSRDGLLAGIGAVTSLGAVYLAYTTIAA